MTDLPQAEPLQRFERFAVLHEHRAVRHRESLVEAEHGPSHRRTQGLDRPHR
jgi:hypothetical protein